MRGKALEWRAERIRRFKYAQSVGWDTKKMAAKFGVARQTACCFAARHRGKTLEEFEAYDRPKPSKMAERMGVDLSLPSNCRWGKENFLSGGLLADDEIPIGTLPTDREFTELADSARQEWVGRGMRFTGRNGGSVFLPAEGVLSGGEIRHVGERGYYWCSMRGGGFGAFVVSREGCRVEPVGGDVLMSFRCVY